MLELFTVGRSFLSVSASARQYYSSLGLAVPIEERDLLITTGGSEAILFTLLALYDPATKSSPRAVLPELRDVCADGGGRIKNAADAD